IGSFNERLDREMLAQFQRRLAIVLAHVFQNAVVIGRIDHDRDRFVVFGRAPNHRRPADVDVLDRLGQGHVRFLDGLLERIEIYHDQIDWLETTFPRFGFVFGVAAFVKQTAVDARVQSFDPAFEHFGKRSETGDVADRDLFFPKQVGCAPGRNDVDTLSLETARKFGDAGFVGNGNERADDFHCRTELTADYTDKILNGCLRLVRKAIRYI